MEEEELYKELAIQVEEDLKQFCTHIGKKKVILCPAGKLTRKMICLLEKEGKANQIIAIWDSNPYICNDNYKNILITSYNELPIADEYEDVCVLICSTINYDEIYQIIEEKQLVEELSFKVIFGGLLDIYFDEYNNKQIKHPVSLNWLKYLTVGKYEASKPLFNTHAETVFNLIVDSKSKEIFRNHINWVRIHDVNSLENNCKLYDRNLYFDSEYYSDSSMEIYKGKEIFLDCGAYDGDTLTEFLEFSQNNYCKYIGIEASHDNYDKLQEIYRKRGVCGEVHNIAVGLYEHDVCFSNKGSASVVSEDGDFVTVKSIDKLCEELEYVSWIKMDIEGMEVEALIGAMEIIKKYKPKCAISVYHNPEDIVKIPLFLHYLVPEYEFKIRHHFSYDYTDIVLYASI